MRRGSLRIYLGAAPGVGKTFAMLSEGQRRVERGTDVVVACADSHGRPNTAAQLAGLEAIPLRPVGDGETGTGELDTDAVIARAPSVALVDDLAHTNAPGSRHAKRWQDVEELLDAGIDVITTLNIEQLESLQDVAERITGIDQRDSIPDEVARGADQVELVDMAPEALRRRMAHGNIYPSESVDAALANYFRVGNLSALRELALVWLADQVDDAVHDYKDAHGILDTWETRERVVVAVTGARSGDQLIRRAARMATRARGDLVGVHVCASEDPAEGPSERLREHRTLLEGLGGAYHEVVGGDVAAALADFARAEHATQLVLGASARSRLTELVRGSVINDVIRRSHGIDVHVISVETPTKGTGREPRSRRYLPAVSRPRRRAGWLVVTLGLPGLTLALANTRGTFTFPSQLLLYLLLVVVASAIGGIGPAAVAAVAGSLAANWFFTSPRHELSIAEAEHALALVVFLVVGVLVSLLVLQASARAEETVRSRAEVEAMQEVSAEERRASEELAAEALLVARADELRVSLLRAVSHDLRSPLASIKASVTSLLQQDVEWTDEATLEFLGTIDEEADRLDELVGNLLDMSRLQSGALQVQARPVAYEEVVPAALASLSGPTDTVEIALDETLPRVHADPALLERVVANLTANAIAASGPTGPVRVEAGSVVDRVDLRIVDRGPGIPLLERDRVFEPFQRLGDSGGGVGLGLAVAKGFVEAMGGELTIEDTPGGGLTMVVGLPEAVEQ